MFRGRKGGVIQWRSAGWLESLLPFPAANFLYYCFSKFKKQVTLRGITEAKQHTELNGLPRGAANVRMNNMKTCHTVCFQYLPTGYYYIALTTYSLKNLIVTILRILTTAVFFILEGSTTFFCFSGETFRFRHYRKMMKSSMNILFTTMKHSMAAQQKICVHPNSRIQKVVRAIST